MFTGVDGSINFNFIFRYQTPIASDSCYFAHFEQALKPFELAFDNFVFVVAYRSHIDGIKSGLDPERLRAAGRVGNFCCVQVCFGWNTTIVETNTTKLIPFNNSNSEPRSAEHTSELP